MSTVRDHLWLWGHHPGTHDGFYHLPGPSRMTPAEAAYYLGVPNMFMIAIGNVPAPPFDQYMISFRPLRQVVWSIVGDSSSTRTDIDAVIPLAAKFPNLTGAIMDDFFHAADAEGNVSRVSVDELAQFRAQLQAAARPLDLYVVVYAHDLALPIQHHLAQCDVITYWTWTADELGALEVNFARLEEMAPAQRKILGCYLWDYGAEKPMPVDGMRRQCELGLRWLREGRIEGIIFLSNSACDQEIETVEWTRQWIAEVGEQTVNP